MKATTPKRAILMTRISDARDGDERGVTDQEADERALADRLGWGVGLVIVENDTSAFKRRKIKLPDGSVGLRTVRPGFRKALDLLARGEYDGLIAYDLDRACRDPRDLEDLIDVVEARSLPVESVTGSLKLANDADITMARILTAMANKASRDTGRRVARARLRQAMAGGYGGGQRSFGFERDGITHRPDEAAELVKAADAILAGVALRQIARDFRERDVKTVTGRPWTAEALRETLKKPRNAAIAVYRGEEIGRGQWEPILNEEKWRAVAARLNDPTRRTTPGNTPRWLGSGLYLCGLCGSTMRVQTSSGHRPAYRCNASAHLVRNASSLDEFVELVIVERLSQPDLASHLARGADVDVSALEEEARVIRTRISEAGDLWEDGTLGKAEYKARVERLRQRLEGVESALSNALGTSPVAELVGAEDVAATWNALDLGRKRAVLERLMTVTVQKQPPGRRPNGSYFDPEFIKIVWKDGDTPEPGAITTPV